MSDSTASRLACFNSEASSPFTPGASHALFSTKVFPASHQLSPDTVCPGPMPPKHAQYGHEKNKTSKPVNKTLPNIELYKQQGKELKLLQDLRDGQGRSKHVQNENTYKTRSIISHSDSNGNPSHYTVLGTKRQRWYLFMIPRTAFSWFYHYDSLHFTQPVGIHVSAGKDYHVRTYIAIGGMLGRRLAPKSTMQNICLEFSSSAN